MANRRWSWKKRMLIGLLVVVSLWLLGDLGYSLYVRYRIGRWERTVVRGSDGVREHCEAFEFGRTEAEVPAVLLVHGINDSPACFRQLAGVLSDRGLFARAMRLPGFALPTQEYARASKEQWLEAVDQELRSLQQRHSRVHLVAHSLGGAISIAYLRSHPAAVDKAVLLAPAVEVSRQRSPLLSPPTWHKISNGLLLFTRVTESPFGLDAVAVDERDYPYRTPYTPRKIFTETFDLLEANRRGPEQFRTPVMLCVSSRDRIIDSEAAEEFVKNCGAPDKRIEHFDDAGHHMMIDQGWERLANSIADFLLDEPR